MALNYVYQYKDHLGNVRLSYADTDNNGIIDANTEIIEENNYYPFGLKHKGYNNVITGRDHKYGFGGKEEQDELGLEWHDFHARNYDAALGRWMNLDPFSEKYSSVSPYNYTLNNPIFFVDPDGKDVINAEEVRKEKAIEVLRLIDLKIANQEKEFGTELGDFNSKADFKAYKKLKGKRRRNQLKKIKKHTKQSEAIQVRIDEFKNASSELFKEMDNLKNEFGEQVDIYVDNKSMSEYNGRNDFGFIQDEDNDEQRVGTELYGINTILIWLDPIPEKTRDNYSIPTTLEVTKHEMGHANYVGQNNMASYRYNLKHPNSEGHGVGHPSGIRAEEWEKK